MLPHYLVFDVLIDYSSFEIHFARGNEGEISDFLRKISPLIVSMSREPAAVWIAIFSAARAQRPWVDWIFFIWKSRWEPIQSARLKRIFFLLTHIAYASMNMHSAGWDQRWNAIFINLPFFFRFTRCIATGNSIKLDIKVAINGRVLRLSDDLLVQNEPAF